MLLLRFWPCELLFFLLLILANFPWIIVSSLVFLFSFLRNLSWMLYCCYAFDVVWIKLHVLRPLASALFFIFTYINIPTSTAFIYYDRDSHHNVLTTRGLYFSMLDVKIGGLVTQNLCLSFNTRKHYTHARKSIQPELPQFIPESCFLFPSN